jgi:alanine dehydrogenase
MDSQPAIAPPNPTVEFLLLGDADLRALLHTSDLLEPVEQALISFSRGEVQNPLRTSLFIGPDRAFFGVMPAYLPSTGAWGAKLITVFEQNKTIGLPTHFGVVLLLDARTGKLRALLDARYLTEVRTAAVSAIAIRHLAGQPPRTLAVLGCGVQARAHVLGFHDVFSPAEIKVWSPGDDLLGFVAAMQSKGVPAAIATCAEAAVRGADVVLLATDSPGPVLRHQWVAAGALVISLGACRADHREMDSELLARSRLFVDSREAALVESGDIVCGIKDGLFGPEHIQGELGEVAAGQVPGRTSNVDTVVFKSLGLGVEDVVAAALAVERALACGAGRSSTI